MDAYHDDHWSKYYLWFTFSLFILDDYTKIDLIQQISIKLSHKFFKFSKNTILLNKVCKEH